jgi:hypothetical protein
MRLLIVNLEATRRAGWEETRLTAHSKPKKIEELHEEHKQQQLQQRDAINQGSGAKNGMARTKNDRAAPRKPAGKQENGGAVKKPSAANGKKMEGRATKTPSPPPDTTMTKTISSPAIINTDSKVMLLATLYL